MFASLLSWLGSVSGSLCKKACVFWFGDEPKMPKSMLNK